jgi:protoheme IX farnesyltransferase
MTSGAGEVVTLAKRTSGLRDYLDLTRPGVLLGVLLTALPAFVLGQPARPDLSVVFGALLGIALVGAGSSALNACWERDADARMERTRARPLPSGRLRASRALAFGVATSLAGLLALFAVGGWVPAAIGAATLAHYLIVYTIWLKPRSAWNTVVGALAGCTAPLIADAAVDGRVGPWGLALAAIVLVWQPPHVFAITLYRREEYAAASFRMLPSAAGDRVTRRCMLAFAVALIPVSLLPLASGALGAGYAAVAAAGGIGFVAAIAAAMRARSAAADRRVFVVSLLYLSGLFGAMLLELGARGVAMSPRELLPHVNGALNAAITALLIAALVAIRRGRRETHRRLMLTAVTLGTLFVILYVVQTSLAGHRRFPGDDWVRTFFLVVLTTHTVLAVAVVPLVARTLQLALRERFAAHRRIVRITYPVWLYVAVTGLFIYAMNNFVRPAL